MNCYFRRYFSDCPASYDSNSNCDQRQHKALRDYPKPATAAATDAAVQQQQ